MAISKITTFLSYVNMFNYIFYVLILHFNINITPYVVCTCNINDAAVYLTNTLFVVSNES